MWIPKQQLINESQMPLSNQQLCQLMLWSDMFYLARVWMSFAMWCTSFTASLVVESHQANIDCSKHLQASFDCIKISKCIPKKCKTIHHAVPKKHFSRVSIARDSEITSIYAKWGIFRCTKLHKLGTNTHLHIITGKALSKNLNATRPDCCNELLDDMMFTG